MKVRQFCSNQLAAVYVAALIENVMRRRPRPVLGLAAGDVFLPVYQQLAAFHRQGLSFQRVTTVNEEEYVGLTPYHVQSHSHFMWRHLWRYIDVPLAQRHIPDGGARDLADECARYDAVLRDHPVDVQILDIERIAWGLKPILSIKTHTQVVPLSARIARTHARLFSNGNEVPTQAITIGIKAILQAQELVVMALGADKMDIVRQSWSGEISTDKPASFLQMHPNVTVVMEATADGRRSSLESGANWDVKSEMGTWP